MRSGQRCWGNGGNSCLIHSAPQAPDTLFVCRFSRCESMWPFAVERAPQVLPDPSMRKRKSPSPDDGRFPRNRAPPVDPEAAFRAASSAPSSATPSASSSSAHGFEPFPLRSPSSAHGFEPSTTSPERRGSSRGARPLRATERLEHGGYCARVVFNPKQIIGYDENGLDYAARLSKSAYFEGYTPIPLGNAPWSVCKRWAKGVLKGPSEGGRDRGSRKNGERQGEREDAQA